MQFKSIIPGLEFYAWLGELYVHLNFNFKNLINFDKSDCPSNECIIFAYI